VPAVFLPAFNLSSLKILCFLSRSARPSGSQKPAVPSDLAAISQQVNPLNNPTTPCATRAASAAPCHGQKPTRPWVFLASIACVAAFAVVYLPAVAAAQEFRIVDVQIEGNTTIPDAVILEKVRSHPDRPVNEQQIREDKRKLYNTRWFSRVEHSLRKSQTGDVLVFTVREQPIVRRVTYAGNSKIKRKVLDSWTGLRVGSPMDPAANREAARQIKRRYEEKGFRFVEVKLEKGGQPTDFEVMFRINEGPKVRVYRREFSGNEFVSGARLKTKLQTKAAILGLPILDLGLFNPDTIPTDVEVLKQYYSDLGYFDVDIKTATTFSDDKAWVTVHYKVIEGQRYKVRNIAHEGNAAIATQKLTAKQSLKRGDFFNARFLNEDVTSMRAQYDDKGHYYAQVSPVPRFLETPGQVDIVYKIDEDTVRLLRRINVHLNNEYSHTKETVVLDRSPISPGDPVSKKLLGRMEGRLASSGIFEPAKLRLQVRPVDKNAGFAINPNKQNVLRGQNPALPGLGHTVGFGQKSLPLTQPISAPLTQPAPRSRSHFKKPVRPESIFRGQSPSPVFQGQDSGPIVRSQIPDPANPIYDVSPQGDPFGRALTAPQPGFVDIDVFASEGRTGRLMFGAGVNSDAGLVGSFVYEEKDFDLFAPPRSFSDLLNGYAWRGGGQQFRAEAVPGDVVSRYSLSWTDPYFMYSDYSLSLSGFHFNRFYPDWNERRGGGRIAVGKQFGHDQSLSVSAAIRLEEVKLSGLRGNPGPPPILQRSGGSSFLSTGRVSVTHDTRDRTVLPSEGHYIQGSYEQAFGDFNYPRFEAEARQFFTVGSRPDGSGRHVISLIGQAGWTGEDTPIFERFYAGGFQSFRGFAFRGVSPTQNSVAIGGEFMALASAEYRFPITAGDGIQGVVFTDFGSIEQDVSLDSFRLTVGAGLRVAIPQMGSVPLAFDFGFPILKEQGDDERIFSFYVSVNR